MPIYDAVYHPSICERIPLMFSDGSSITKVAAVKLGIARSTYYQWKENYPEFKKACEIGENLSECAMEDIGQRGMNGEIANYNATTYIFTMKNRFRETYGEQKDDKEKSAGDTLLEQVVNGKTKIVTSE